MMLVPLSPEQLHDALDSATPGGAAEGWRLLRDDVRALAPTLDPAFERELYARLEAPRGPRGKRKQRAPIPRRLAAWAARLGAPQLLAGAGIVGCALAVAVAVLSITRSGESKLAPVGIPRAFLQEGAQSQSEPRPSSGGRALPAESSPSVRSATASGQGAEAAAPARVQERAASITLAAQNSQVQAIADGVSRLASNEGGYVVDSQVNVQAHGTGEATLTLSLPSAHLERALAALGRLAAVRSQSNSLQDITSSYESDKRALADAVAERSGLLRALAHATTQGEIESLRRRLSLAGGTIARDTAALQSVSRRAANSRVEVSVLSSAGSAEGQRSTLSRGLDDAGHVLAVVLVGLLIALAVLVPLGLLALLGALAGRRWQRWQRERVLDES